MATPSPGDLSAAPEEKLSHLDAEGHARMVDVSAKADTKRIARAEGFISMDSSTLDMIVEGRAPKGDVLAVARIAGIMGAKQTSSIIPLCHPLPMTHASVDLEPVRPDDSGQGRCGIHVIAETAVTGKTGIEMEALTAASIACLTVYDMCKAVDRGMEIGPVRLLRKEGGKTGLWVRGGEGND
ncbi:MAG: cyclic pyranopterin monophosphate synthase MoaC [Eggerthellaceae bacterium]|jgi:cyclic pyranopterin phosphate synthase